MRRPCVAGQFYDDRQLRAQIESCFLSHLGPGSLPRGGQDAVKAIVAPHAGYMFSGPCAAWAYKALAESKVTGTVLVLGVNHHSSHTCLSLEDWMTPLGVVHSDKERIHALDIPVMDDEHRHEHSIEVQLPFLQFINKDAKIIPLMVSHDMRVEEIAEKIRPIIHDVTVIVSSDFTHYGPSYGFVPFTEDVKRRMAELDKKAISFVERGDASGFLDFVQGTMATICGALPIAVLLRAMRLKGKLLKYYTSGDVISDYRNAVGYAAITLREAGL